jgi:hypothetical protein
MKKIITASLIVMILVLACKKNTEEVTLKGKWNLESVITKEYRNGSLTNTNTEPGDGYKYDFQDSGILLITSFLSSSSGPYTILPNSKVDIDGEVFEIRNLTSSSVTLFFRMDFNPDEYDEIYINLKR